MKQWLTLTTYLYHFKPQYGGKPITLQSKPFFKIVRSLDHDFSKPTVSTFGITPIWGRFERIIATFKIHEIATYTVVIHLFLMLLSRQNNQNAKMH